MDVDAAEASVNSSTRSPMTGISTTTASQAYAPLSDLQQRYAAVQSRTDASPGVEGGATPPPHLDLLRDERERARRQILEALGAAPSSATTAQPSNDSSAAAAASLASAAPSVPASSAAPSDAWASATISALLGAAAAAPNANAPAPSLDPSSSGSAAPVNPIRASAPASQARLQQPQPQQQRQQRPLPARPQAFRVPLQPEMISGTSMVVQGALVARILADRPASSQSSSSQPANSSQNDTARQATRNETSTASPPPGPSDASSTGSGSDPGVPGATLEGDTLRGAVTLEEQAVMLSRILGIAAAATAASLLNTSEAQHVDPSLLQTSLRRPFERMNQASNDRNQRWLADWQRNGSNQRSSSISSDAEPTRGQGSNHPFAGMPRHRQERLMALGRQMSEHVNGSGDSGHQQRRNAGNHINDASTAREASPAAIAAAVDGGSARDQTDTRQEIIAHLIGAAERERLTRLRSADQPTPSSAAGPSDGARSSSFSASGHLAHSAQQDAPRRGLSRLIRSTIGSFLHPSRLLPGRNTQSTEGSSSGSHQEGWTSASTDRSGSSPAAAPSSDFSLGPNDVVGTLRQVRNGILPDGVPGSFGSFLNHLVNDLMAAVQLMRPSIEASVDRAEAQTPQMTNYFEHATRNETTTGAEVLDGDISVSQPQARTAQASEAHASAEEEDLETQARRQRDFENGNLSFFRLFRFDPVAPSQLVPCIVVGVRSLSVMERFGEEMNPDRAQGSGRNFNGSRQQTSRPTTLGSARPTATLGRQRAQSDGGQTSTPSQGGSTEANGEELPSSRFMLFVSGGRYPPNHPLLTSNPATAGRDLMILMDLLSTMQAMQHKPKTVTQAEIDASDLLKIKGSEVAAKVRDGKITENMAERCLVCLEDWQDDDDCRVLACRHAFHTTCVDRWMTSSSNTCPMCRRRGVSKDGHQAGAETADSRRAAQV